jgi:ABC-type glycerol-3-phosphate transport system substrate-binding protein
MNPRALLAAAPIALALLVAGCSSTAMSGSPAMSESPSAMTSGAKSQSPSATMSDAMSAHGSYVSLADYQAAMSKYAGGTTVYFFSSMTSADSSTADTALMASGAIPAKVTVVKVDFDSASDLRTTYGVTMADTFVQVDKSGARVIGARG